MVRGFAKYKLDEEKPYGKSFRLITKLIFEILDLVRIRNKGMYKYKKIVKKMLEYNYKYKNYNDNFLEKRNYYICLIYCLKNYSFISNYLNHDIISYYYDNLL